MIWMVVLAHAQSVPNGDFELGTSLWDDVSVDCTDYLDMLPPDCSSYPGFYSESVVARGAYSGELEAYYYSYSPAWTAPMALSAPFLVTSNRLTWAQSPANTGSVTLDGVAAGARLAGPASADSFTQYERDISAACGQTAQVRLESSYNVVRFEDVALGGAACPMFIDADGDGFCPQGADLDGDLDCTDADEVNMTPDCDDTDAAVGSCVKLGQRSWIEVGEGHRFKVEGAVPGETMSLYTSAARGTSCPVELAGGCIGLAEPAIALGSAVVDASGRAVFEVVAPAGPTYSEQFFQAAGSVYRSEVGGSFLVPASQTPQRHSAHSVYNGNFELGGTGWPADSEGYDFGYYSDHDNCPQAEIISSPARGTGALSLVSELRGYPTLCGGRVHGWPMLVTRSTLQWATVGEVSLDVIRLDDAGVVHPTVAGPVVSADGFSEFRADLSSVCGAEIRLDLSYDGPYDDEALAQGLAVVDAIRLSGPPCPAYLDSDGDGTCLSGVDTDGDGACVSLGEQDPPPDDTIPLERLLLDFETDTPPIERLSDDELVAIHSLGGYSGYVDPGEGTSVDLPGEVVTHESLSVMAATRGVGDWPTATLDITVQSFSFARLYDAPVDRGPGRWQQVVVDLSGRCGQAFDTLQFDVSPSDWVDDFEVDPFLYDNSDYVLLDDIGFLGEPCPTLVDTDGDGLCREGIDVDGDGLCVSVGEPSPGVVQDPSE